MNRARVELLSSEHNLAFGRGRFSRSSDDRHHAGDETQSLRLLDANHTKLVSPKVDTLTLIDSDSCAAFMPIINYAP